MIHVDKVKEQVETENKKQLKCLYDDPTVMSVQN